MVSLTAVVVMHCFHNTLKSVLYKARNLFVLKFQSWEKQKEVEKNGMVT